MRLSNPFNAAFRFPLVSLLGLCSLPGQEQSPIPDSLELETAILYAVENNFSIRQAQLRIREQEGLIITVRANALPSVSLNANYTERDAGLSEPRGFFEPITATWNLNFQVRQAVYSGGKLSHALDAQKYIEEAAVLDLQSVINQAVLETRTRFYDVLLARDQIEVETLNVELLEEQLVDAKNRYEAGAVSSFEVIRSEVELANSQPILIRAQNRFRVAVESLRQTLGYLNDDPMDALKIPEFIGELNPEPSQFDLVESLEAARAYRPEILRLEKIALARGESIKLEKASNRPEVDAVAGYGANRSFPSSSISDSLRGWTLALQTNWDIFDGRAKKGRLVQARARMEQANLDYWSQRLFVEVEVRQAYSDFLQSEQLVSAAVKVSEQAEEALRLAEARYAAGDGTQLDVLQTRVALTQARTNQLEANYSYNVASAKLRQAIGEPDPVIRK
jgi:outer membrane protein TolC